MAISQTNAYKLEKRQYYKITTREGLFVADFVKTKYPEIYQESAMLYNRINQIHPNKPNIRKTIEYRTWKNQIAEANNQPTKPIPRQRNQLNKHLLYPNMSTGPTTTENITPQSDSSDESATENITPQTDSSDQTATENTPGPSSRKETHQLAGKQMMLTIPLIPYPNTPKSIQSPTKILETAYTESIVEEGDQQEILDPSLLDVVPDDVVDKIIAELHQDPCLKDLIPYPNTPKSIQSPTKILETAYTESIVEEGDQQEILDPSLLDVVPDDVVDKIIAELHQDPCLKDIMLDMEKQLTTQEELVGLEVDVPDIYDPLEDELENMCW